MGKTVWIFIGVIVFAVALGAAAWLYFFGIPEDAPSGARNPAAMLEGMDADGDGDITRNEFTGPERMFDRMDEDGDGVISSEELEVALERFAQRGPRRGDGGRRAFQRTFEEIDVNSDSLISPDEFEGGERFFQRLDIDSSGTVSHEEFEIARERAMSRQRPPEGQ